MQKVYFKECNTKIELRVRIRHKMINGEVENLKRITVDKK